MAIRNLIRISVLSIMAVFLFSCKTEEIALHGNIKGLVTDAESSEPVQAASVKLNPSDYTTSTGIDGRYLIKDLVPGNYEIEVSKQAYKDETKNGTVTPATTTEVNFALNGVPFPELSDSVIDFGFNSTLRSFTVSNMGRGKFRYSLYSSKNWITVSPDTGTITNDLDTIKVTVNRTGLPEKKTHEIIEITYFAGQDILRDTVNVLLNGVRDKDGNYYGAVKIGTQTWLAENLNTGKMVKSFTNSSDNEIIEKYCYNDVIFYCKTYGGLYDWYEMMQYQHADTGTIGTTRGICPDGWHIPTKKEWLNLIYYLGGESIYGSSAECYSNIGGKLKEEGTEHWLDPNVGATNETGFTALPGGGFLNYTYWYEGEVASWWTSQESNSTIYQDYNHVDVCFTSGEYTGGGVGGSLRCIKDY